MSPRAGLTLLRSGWATWLAGAALLATCAGQAGAVDPEEPFRMAFSSYIFLDVNRNDAKAAIKTWIQTAAKERQLNIAPDIFIPDNSAALIKAFAEKRLDAAIMTAEEFFTVAGKVPLNDVFGKLSRSGTLENYVVMVHTNAGITNLAHLKGGSLLIHQSAWTCLAENWLNMRLAAQQLPSLEEWFQTVTRKIKPAEVVLPVFFRKTDACLITRRQFELQAELNPQLGKQLQILEASPPLVVGMLAFRADYQSPNRPGLINAFLSISNSVAGRQILTLLRVDGGVPMEPGQLESARIIYQYGQQRRRESGGNPAVEAARP